MKNKYILGTRGSELALTQARSVARQLEKTSPGIEVEIKTIKTSGDTFRERALTGFEDKGIFTSAIERALLDGEIDFAVHSMKDLPSKLADGLKLIDRPPKRADHHDVLLVKKFPVEKIGTSSERRKKQLKKLFPLSKTVPIRGNITTRINKLKEGEFDAVVLARAGLERLGYDAGADGLKPIELDVLPSPGQGILAVEIREGDDELNRLLSKEGDSFTALQARAERAFLEELDVGCDVPVGALLEKDGEDYRFRAFLNGKTLEAKLTKDEIDTVPRELARRFKRAGRVFLVGCGPGDPELLTLKAVKKIEQADVIVYDALIDPEILNLSTAERIYVGKRGNHHVKEQDEINALLVELANQGKNVVRLKGGDPYIFGRGVEEALFLRDHGIDFEVVPGISSVTGGSACAGIPLTYRENNNAFAVVTAQTKKDSPGPDYETLARFDGTLVFVMGIGRLADIVENLKKNGKDPNTPVGIVENATLKNQRVTTGSLTTIVEKAKARNVKAPGLIIIGKNVLLHKILCARKILVLRSRAQASKLSDALKKAGLLPVEYALLEIKEDTDEIARLKKDDGHYDRVIFTSENGVALFAKHIGFDKFRDVKVYAIGPATQEKLESYGIKATRPDSYRAEALAELIEEDLKPDERILLVHAHASRPVLKERLGKICPVSEYFIYEAIAGADDSEGVKQMLDSGTIDGVAFTSSSCVKNFLKTFGNNYDLDYFSIGPVTSATAKDEGLKVRAQARSYTIDGLTEAIKQYYESTDKT